MLAQVLIWGTVVGLIHFVAIGILYGNPIVGRMYVEAQSDPAMRRWPSRPRYLATQFAGTQVEIYLITLAYLWLRGAMHFHGLGGALLLGTLFAALRVYPRFWNMWIQSSYPRRLLFVEVVNGTLGTLLVTAALELIV